MSTVGQYDEAGHVQRKLELVQALKADIERETMTHDGDVGHRVFHVIWDGSRSRPLLETDRAESLDTVKQRLNATYRCLAALIAIMRAKNLIDEDELDLILLGAMGRDATGDITDSHHAGRPSINERHS